MTLPFNHHCISSPVRVRPHGAEGTRHAVHLCTVECPSSITIIPACSFPLCLPTCSLPAAESHLQERPKFCSNGGKLVQVIIECCLGMALCVLGTSSSGAKLQPVFAKRECAERCEITECGDLLSRLCVWSRSYDKSIGAVSLMTFNHRARSLADWPTTR